MIITRISEGHFYPAGRRTLRLYPHDYSVGSAPAVIRLKRWVVENKGVATLPLPDTTTLELNGDPSSSGVVSRRNLLIIQSTTIVGWVPRFGAVSVYVV